MRFLFQLDGEECCKPVHTTVSEGTPYKLIGILETADCKPKIRNSS